MTGSRIADATWIAFGESIRFIVVPVVLVNLVTTNYPTLRTAFMPGLASYILLFGTLIVGARTLECAYVPGSYKRLLFGLSVLAFVCFWTFVLFGGWIAEFDYPPYHVSFDMSKVLYIVLFGLSLRGLLVIETFRSNRGAVKKPAARDAAPPPTAPASYASFSKVAFRVTSDDSVGHTEPLSPNEPAAEDFKECPVCGVKVSPRETTCNHCGTWLAGPGKRPPS